MDKRRLRRSGRWARAGALLMSLVVLPAAGAAAGTERPVLTVHVVNYARVPRDILFRARAAVDEIFAAAGVEIRWTTGPTASPRDDPSEPASSAARRVTIMLVDVEGASGGTTVGIEGHHFGLAVPRRGAAYVFYNRIVHHSRERPLDFGLVLGRVIAHELGHVLMPPGQHATYGIMRGGIDFGLENPDRFTAEEAQRVRSALVVRP